MKRLKSAIISSDSEDENLSKIKNDFKKSNKSIIIKDSSKKSGAKKHKPDTNQMSIESAFSKSILQKRQGEPSIENFFQKIPKVQKKVEQQLSANSPTTSVNNFSFNTKSEKTSSISSLPTIPKLSTNSSYILKESIPKIKKFETKDSILPSPKKLPIKTNVIGVSESSSKIKKQEHKDTSSLSSKKSPIKSNVAAVPNISSPASIKSKVSYAQYMHRGGPQALGSKEVPEGSPNCLIGMTFVITGVLESIERDDAQSLIERHGGRVTKAVSGRTTYLVLGQEPGESKVNKAKQLKTKQINENELFDLIRKSSLQLSQNPKSSDSKVQKSAPESSKKKSLKVTENAAKIEASNKMSGDPIINKSEIPKTLASNSTLLVDKYSPNSLKEIIGQQGDRSPANKLLAWLKNFDANLNSNSKSDDDGSSFRAALLSGPPGIGKSTTARVVCKMLGYSAVEFNASCVRSKTNIKNKISESLSTTPFHKREGIKHCIIMDEIDGMAGNEDRGGINELMQVIKTTKHPIICICNDRQSRKLQAFGKYVYDLRYRQLTIDQMKVAINKIAYEEGFSLPEDVLNCIIRSSNFDMRQVLNNLQMWTAGNLESETLKDDAKNAIKEFKIGPFDVINKVFSHEGIKTMSDKSDLFFYDYQLGGLFVQENYPSVRPYKAKNNMKMTMKLMSLAADNISMGDLVSAKIMSNNNWGLLPTQAMFSSVIPGEYLHGRLTSRILFPSFLGKYSKTNKNYRVLSSLRSHLSLSTKGGVFNSSTISMDYGELLVKKFISPLREGDITAVLKNLEESQLMKEDMDLLIEAMSWPHIPNPLADIATQVKSAVTRAYNKSNLKLPYAIISVKKSLKSVESSSGLGLLEEDDIDEEEVKDDNDINGDWMMIKKGNTTKPTPATKVSKGGKSSSKKSEETKEMKVIKRVKK